MTVDIPAQQSLGQNWLINEGVLDRIVDAADLGEKDVVLEVGPGKGALTGRLARRAQRVVALEKDSRLIPLLHDLFADTPHVEIRRGDILKTSPTELGLMGAYKVVANIPYYITSRLIRLLLEVWPPPSQAVLMVQYEVARRMLAHPPNMNLLALSVQLFAEAKLIMRVSRGSFRPMPDVDSAVISLTPYADVDRKKASRILWIAKKAFGTKRKQLSASIPPQALEAAGISPKARPQELSVGAWQEIAARLP